MMVRSARNLPVTSPGQGGSTSTRPRRHNRKSCSAVPVRYGSSVQPAYEQNGMQKSADEWEAGCTRDQARNDYIIPAIVRVIERSKPRSILDLGAGTGYVARSVEASLSYRPDWTLLDRDTLRLNVAKSKSPDNMQVTYKIGDFNQGIWNASGSKFDAIVVCFSLVEFLDEEEAYSAIVDVVSPGSILIIVVPDPWEEVRDNGVERSALLSRRISTEKVDKFTASPYPYHLSRNELILEGLLTKGFYLTGIERLNASSPSYMLVFGYGRS